MSPLTPPLPRSGLGRLITFAGPSVLLVTIARIHRHPGAPPAPAWDSGQQKMLLLAWVSCLAWWVASRRPLSSGRLAASGRDNGALCASAGPLARALKMGLAGESSFFLISRFKGMRGAGQSGKVSAACPGERARAPFPRGEALGALSGAGMCQCGSDWAICHQPCRHRSGAGATPEPRAPPEESLTSSSDAPGSARDGAGWCWDGRCGSCRLGGQPPELLVSVLVWEFADVLDNATF